MQGLVLPGKQEVLDWTTQFDASRIYPYKSGDDLCNYLKEIDTLFGGEQMLTPPFVYWRRQKNCVLPFTIFRARKAKEVQNRSSMGEYSYPPPQYPPKNQRANLEGIPVFYGADSPITALAEILDNNKLETAVGETYYISRWEINNQANLSFVTFLNNELAARNAYKGFAFSFDSLKETYAEVANDDQIEGLLELMQFYGNLFVDDSKYLSSAYIAHNYLFRHKEEINAIPDSPGNPSIFLYPSIQAIGRDINFAIDPDFVDKEMWLKYVCEVKITGFDTNSEGKIEGISFSFGDEWVTNMRNSLYWTARANPIIEKDPNDPLWNDFKDVLLMTTT